jgi:NAD kinase
VKAINTVPAAFLTADGQIVGELAANDEITIRRSRHSVRLLRLAESSFLEALRRKLHWRGTYL